MQRVLLPLIDGLAGGVLLFLASSGLTLIYGVMRVLNFSHGGFFMLGAFITYSLTGGGHQVPALVLVALMLAAGVLTAASGAVAEVVLFRRLYGESDLTSLLGTFALLLTLQGLGRQVWGINGLSQPQSNGFLTRITVRGLDIPVYDLFLLGIGVITVVGLEYLVLRTEFGRMVRATAADRTMAALTGIDVRRVFLTMFCLGIFLAGLGGGLISPLIGLTPDLAVDFIIQAFAVVIIGGLGSIRGAFVAALLLGLLNAYLVTFVPQTAEFSVYFGLIVVLLVRPQGLFGRSQPSLA